MSNSKKSNNFNYFPHRMPPDWNQVALHKQASILGIPENENDNIKCPCCNNFINKTLIPYCADKKYILFTGEGIPLYWNFVKFCLILLLGSILCDSVISIFQNLTENNCIDIMPQECNFNYSNSLAYTKGGSTSSLRFILKIISFFCQILILLYFRMQQKSEALNLEETSDSTIAAYTIMVQNIPHGFSNYKQKLGKLVNSLCENIQIQDCLLIKDLSSYYQEEEKLLDIVQQIRQGYKNEINPNQLIDLQKNYQQQLNILVNRGKIIEADAEQQKYFTGNALITVNTIEERKILTKQINKMQTDKIKEIFSKDNHEIENRMIAMQAQQPRDIIWKNIHFVSQTRLKSLIIGSLVSILFLGGITLGFFYLIKYKAYMIHYSVANYKYNKQKYFQQYQLGILLCYSTIILINIFNKFILSEVLYFITKHQKHKSYSEFQFSFAIKYMIGMFFTTAIMTLIVQALIYENYTDEFGVVDEQTFMFIFNALFSPLVALINPSLLKILYKRFRNQNSKVLTQEQANKLYEYPQYDIGKRYAQIMKTIWFTYLYLYLIPVGAAISFVGLIIYYAIDKFILLRLSFLKDNISKLISENMVGVLDMILIIKPFGELIFDIQLRNTVPKESIAMLCLGIIYILAPKDWIIDYFFRQKEMNRQNEFINMKDKERYSNYFPTRKYEKIHNSFEHRNANDKIEPQCEEKAKINPHPFQISSKVFQQSQIVIPIKN